MPLTSAPESHPRGHWWLLPVLLTLAVYAEVIQGGFVWDDHTLIESQALVQHVGPLPDYFTRMFWSDPDAVSSGYYRPLVTLSYALEQQLWDGAAAGFHLTNLLLHLVVVVLVYLLARRGGASPRAASLAAAVFGVFPRLSESVAWVSGRTDVMATGFVLAALLACSADDPGRRRPWAAGALLFLGLLCKELAVAGILGLLVLEHARVRSGARARAQAAHAVVPALLALLLYGALRLYALSQDVRGLAPVESGAMDLSQRGLAALAALGHYAAMLATPLSPRLEIGTLGVHPPAWVVLGALVLGGVFLLGRYARRTLPPLGQALLAAAGLSLALVLHLVPLGLHTLASDRFLYLPVAALAAALAPALARRASAPAWALGLLWALVLASLCGATFLRTRDWRSDATLWQATARTAEPDNAYVQQQLGDVYMSVHRYDDALVHLQRSVQRESRTGGLKAYNNLALCLSKLERHGEALALFEDIVRQQPSYRRGHLNLALAYARAGRFAQALSTLEHFGTLAPGDPALAPVRSLVQQAQAVLTRPAPALPQRMPAADAEQRARALQSLGAPYAAAAAWDAVAQAPDATPEQRLQALTSIVMEGPLPLARQALERARRLAPAEALLPQLEQALRGREAPGTED